MQAMAKKKNKGKKVVLVGHLYEQEKEKKKPVQGRKPPKKEKPRVEMGKFLLTIPKDLRREIKFESDERGFGNVSAYICHILRKRNLIFTGCNNKT